MTRHAFALLTRAIHLAALLADAALGDAQPWPHDTRPGDSPPVVPGARPVRPGGQSCRRPDGQPASP